MTASPPSAQRFGAACAVALHVAAGAALVSYEPARSALLAAAPIMVDLIAPPPPRKPLPPVEIIPPKPKPAPKPVVKPRPKPPEPPPPLVTAPAEAPTPVLAPPPPPPPAVEPQPVLVAPPAPPAPPPPVPVTAPIFNADYLRNPSPVYPALSRRLGEEGRVVLRVLVSPAGAADEVQVRATSGHQRLDEAAREAVQRWKFVPARRGEQPVAAWVLIPVSFRLEG